MTPDDLIKMGYIEKKTLKSRQKLHIVDKGKTSYYILVNKDGILHGDGIPALYIYFKYKGKEMISSIYISDGILYREKGYALNLHYIDSEQKELIYYEHHQKKMIKKEKSPLNIKDIDKLLLLTYPRDKSWATVFKDIELALKNSDLYSLHSYEPSKIEITDFGFWYNDKVYDCSKKVEFFKDNKYHRENGPALIFYGKNGKPVHSTWYLEGQFISNEYL